MKINLKSLEMRTSSKDNFQETVEYYLSNGVFPEESRKYARDYIKYQNRISEKNEK